MTHTPYIDPRGPRRKIVKVGGENEWLANRVEFECGHVTTLNPIFKQTVGATGHCFECWLEARNAIAKAEGK